MNYGAINIKTHYELLSSMIKINDLISYAIKNNITSIGVTDTNMFSFAEFYFSCKKNNIKPIVGVPFLINDISIILYAKNYAGYVSLCRLVSVRNTDFINLDQIKNHAENLICVLINKSHIHYNQLNKIFSDIYVGYNNNNELKECLTICDKALPINEIFCLNKNDSPYLNYLYMIKEGKTLDDKFDYNFADNYYKFYDIEDEKRIKEFSDKINIDLPTFNFNLPSYRENSSEYLRILCKKGLEKRNCNNKKYLSRLDYELDVIDAMGFVDYFLIVYDIVLHAKKNNIYIGPGRGSAVSSLVAYSLGIIEIDPLKYNLLFERFLNPARISMPDIDIDISDRKRNQVVDYVKNKYGENSVANIIAFSSLQPKQVLRDVGKILNISQTRIDAISSIIKDTNNFDDLNSDIKYKEIIKFDNNINKLIDICKHLEGLKSHVTIHAAGIVLDNENLSNKVPLYKSTDTVLVSYDKHYIEKFGILKIDLLSITNLTIIEEILKEIKDVYNININLNNIPLDDKKTLDLFKLGKTLGIFQFESLGIKNTLKKMNVTTFNDIVITNAMFRPGPIEMIPQYLKLKKFQKKVEYPVKKLNDILKETRGIMVYQEQLLEILKVMGGYTYSEADVIRSAIKSKKEAVISNYKKDFIIRCIKNHYKKDEAINIYNHILKFANYGFNKSHSVAYSLIGYQMAYLKANYSDIFMINLLNRDINSKSKTKEYIEESKFLGLKFKAFDINKSKNIYYINKEKEIEIPLTLINNINERVINIILKQKNYKSFLDFCKTCYGTIVNREILESLVMCGVFDSFKYNRKTLMENIEEILNYTKLCQELGNIEEISIKEYDEYDSCYLLEKEIELVGFYFSNHPVNNYDRTNMVTSDNISAYFSKTINIILLVESIKEIKTKNGEKMAFLKLSDEYSTLEGVVFPKIYEKVTDLKKMLVYQFNVTVEKRFNNYQLIINEIK